MRTRNLRRPRNVITFCGDRSWITPDIVPGYSSVWSDIAPPKGRVVHIVVEPHHPCLFATVYFRDRFRGNVAENIDRMILGKMRELTGTTFSYVFMDAEGRPACLSSARHGDWVYAM